MSLKTLIIASSLMSNSALDCSIREALRDYTALANSCLIKSIPWNGTFSGAIIRAKVLNNSLKKTQGYKDFVMIRGPIENFSSESQPVTVEETYDIGFSIFCLDSLEINYDSAIIEEEVIKEYFDSPILHGIIQCQSKIRETAQDFVNTLLSTGQVPIILTGDNFVGLSSVWNVLGGLDWNIYSEKYISEESLPISVQKSIAEKKLNYLPREKMNKEHSFSNSIEKFRKFVPSGIPFGTTDNECFKSQSEFYKPLVEISAEDLLSLPTAWNSVLPHCYAISASELHKLTPEQLIFCVPSISAVFRCTPSSKAFVVKAWSSAIAAIEKAGNRLSPGKVVPVVGHVSNIFLKKAPIGGIVMVGDGGNDIEAMQSADAGIYIGPSNNKPIGDVYYGIEMVDSAYRDRKGYISITSFTRSTEFSDMRAQPSIVTQTNVVSDFDVKDFSQVLELFRSCVNFGSTVGSLLQFACCDAAAFIVGRIVLSMFFGVTVPSTSYVLRNVVTELSVIGALVFGTNTKSNPDPFKKSYSSRWGRLDDRAYIFGLIDAIGSSLLGLGLVILVTCKMSTYVPFPMEIALGGDLTARGTNTLSIQFVKYSLIVRMFMGMKLFVVDPSNKYMMLLGTIFFIFIAAISVTKVNRISCFFGINCDLNNGLVITSSLIKWRDMIEGLVDKYEFTRLFQLYKPIKNPLLNSKNKYTPKIVELLHKLPGLEWVAKRIDDSVSGSDITNSVSTYDEAKLFACVIFIISLIVTAQARWITIFKAL